MTDDTRGGETFQALRAQAMALLKGRGRSGIDIDAQELEVRQIELELQNQELRRVQAELEASRDEYADLYEKNRNGYDMNEGSKMIISWKSIEHFVLLSSRYLTIIPVICSFSSHSIAIVSNRGNGVGLEQSHFLVDSACVYDVIGGRAKTGGVTPKAYKAGQKSRCIPGHTGVSLGAAPGNSGTPTRFCSQQLPDDVQSILQVPSDITHALKHAAPSRARAALWKKPLSGIFLLG